MYFHCSLKEKMAVEKPLHLLLVALNLFMLAPSKPCAWLLMTCEMKASGVSDGLVE